MERLDMLPPLSPPANLSQGPLPLRPREHFLHRPSLYMYIYKKAVWNSKKKKKKRVNYCYLYHDFLFKKRLNTGGMCKCSGLHNAKANQEVGKLFLVHKLC